MSLRLHASCYLVPGPRHQPIFHVITSYVHEILIKAFLERRWGRTCIDLLPRFTAIPELGTADSWLWEGYVLSPNDSEDGHLGAHR
jgi:hypothetical protein